MAFLSPITTAFKISNDNEAIEEISYKNDSLETIAKTIFLRDEVFSERIIFFSDDEEKAFIALEYFYCSMLSDSIDAKDRAERFYNKGMSFLDDYAEKHARRNMEKYNTLEDRTGITEILGDFYHQPWFINDKNILKGMMFEHLRNRMNMADLRKNISEQRALETKMNKQYCKNMY
ncbi:MAG: hypothetical protein RR575_07995 [Acinetobacter sp.]